MRPDLPGYGEVQEAIREAARNGDPILPLHRELQEAYMRSWPAPSRFGYDALHNHATKHMGVEQLRARLEVRREAETWARDLDGIREEHSAGFAILQEMAGAAVQQMAEGKILLTAPDCIRIFGLLRRIEQEEATSEQEAELLRDYRRALELLADVVGRLATERLRLEVREEIRRSEARGSRPAVIARAALLRWNDYPPAEHELVDELTVAN